MVMYHKEPSCINSAQLTLLANAGPVLPRWPAEREGMCPSVATAVTERWLNMAEPLYMLRARMSY